MNCIQENTRLFHPLQSAQVSCSVIGEYRRKTILIYVKAISVVIQFLKWRTCRREDNDCCNYRSTFILLEKWFKWSVSSNRLWRHKPVNNQYWNSLNKPYILTDLIRTFCHIFLSLWSNRLFRWLHLSVVIVSVFVMIIAISCFFLSVTRFLWWVNSLLLLDFVACHGVDELLSILSEVFVDFQLPVHIVVNYLPFSLRATFTKSTLLLSKSCFFVFNLWWCFCRF